MSTVQDAVRVVVKRLAALSLEDFEKENIVGIAEELGVKPEQLLDWVTKARAAKKNTPTVKWRDSTEFVELKKQAMIVDRIVVKGVVTQLTGKPKIGKTTFLLDMASKTIRGGNFLGEKTTPGTILFVSEQNLISFQAELANSGLLTREKQMTLEEQPKFRFQYLCSEDWFNLSWVQIVNTTLDHALEVGAVLVIFDTVVAISQMLKPNDQGEMLAVLSKTKLLSNAGISVIYSMHARKAGGDASESSMGSIAAPGFCDVILKFDVAESRLPKSYRKLDVKGRFGVFDLIIERKTSDFTSRYELVGQPVTVRRRDLKGRIMDLFEDEDTELSAKDIKEAVQQRKASIQTALNELVEFKELERSGVGTKNDPYMYSLAPQDNDEEEPY